jgi:hypothetical protein
MVILRKMTVIGVGALNLGRRLAEEKGWTTIHPNWVKASGWFSTQLNS